MLPPKTNWISTLVLLAAYCATVAASTIERELTLDNDGHYHLKWEVNFETKIITFTATVNATGFVGLGISPTPSMAGADIVIGGVSEGTPYFKDYHALRNGAPVADASQDWTLVSANEEAGITSMTFSRLLATCDDDDVEITSDTQNLIWSIGETDDIQYHGPTNRGAVTLNLLDPSPDLADLSQFHVWNITHQYDMPSRDTTYWCTVHKMPQGFNGTETHIVAFDIILNSEASRQHVHHAVLRRCTPPAGIPSEDFFERYIDHPGDECYAMLPDIPNTECLPFIYIWNIGSGPLILPEHVGYAMGETGSTEYIMMEIHYNNPQELSGVTTDAGISIYYTIEKREVNGAVMLVGSYPSHHQTIPPETTEFVSVAHCGSECTGKGLPQDGVDAFTVIMHSHLTGRKIKVRHFRGTEELPWIANDDHYDFNYQSSRPLRENVKLLPGDHLSVECTYNTEGRTGVTLGGHPTSDEMCQTFLWIYPFDQFYDCQSRTEPMTPLLNMFGIEEIQWDGTMDEDPRVVRPTSLFNRTYSSVLNEDSWSAERKAEVQQLSRYGMQQQFCTIHTSPTNVEENNSNSNSKQMLVNYPAINSEYEPEESCPSSAK